MLNQSSSERWHSKMIGPRLPFYRRPVRPADVSDGLCSVMLSREIALEDVDYSKVVPNRYIVEVNPENYARNFQPIQARVVKQWSERLLTCLTTTNSRLGRRAFRLGGPLQIDIRPAQDLDPAQVRVLARIQPEGEHSDPPEGRTGGVSSHPGACLEMFPGGGRWRLRPGITSLGRDDSNEIILNMPPISEFRLVSGQHAYVRGDEAHFWIFDGSPSGRPSINGTFVNNRRVPPEGLPLYEGDLIILASLDPNNPRPDTPGVAALRFSWSC